MPAGAGIAPERVQRHGHQMRHRRPAERRQVDPLQCPDQGRHRRGQLPVLHDRAQRRRGAGAGPAPERAGRDRQAAEVHPDRGRVRRHRRPGRRRGQRRGPGQQVPRPHPRGRRDHPRGALLREPGRHPRQQQGRPDRRHRDHRYRAGAGRPGFGREGPAARRALGQDRRQGRQGPRRSARPRPRRASMRASPRARWACPRTTRPPSATCSC